MLSAIKVAVLAPCIKLSINGGEGLHIGSPAQVDFTQVGAMLESAVLRRFSQVSLLDDETPLEAHGAHAIFPELREILAHVQREVQERLQNMMAEAGSKGDRPQSAANKSAGRPSTAVSTLRR